MGNAPGHDKHERGGGQPASPRVETAGGPRVVPPSIQTTINFQRGGGVFQRLQFKLLERIHGNNTVRKGVMICPDGGQTTCRTAQYRPRAHRAYEYKYRIVAHNLS